MNIGIDIDDTITETSEFLMPYVAKYFSIDIDYLKKNNICYNNLPKEYKEKEVEFGKSTFGKVLLDVKLKQHANPFGFTSKQLEKLGIKYDKLVCSFNKRKICIDEKIDFFIDDSIENLNKVEGSVGKVLLFNSKTNIGEDNHFTRVNSWQEIYRYISDYKNNVK